ncbi:MAG TPA: FAD-dependent oxidoreductase [Patescibacteria group bacterium]|nr:FAD-dependent oxidoreductase [Patescibacteria group bacterium]
METFRTKLLRKREVAERTAAFYFEKPKGFQFRAGQFIDLTLVDPAETDAAGSTRTFTLASAPYEDELMIATRMRASAFKRVLAGLSPGAVALLEGPMGSFTLHSNASKPAVFLAGGIGITPFVSISKQAAHDRLPHRIHLFYSNQRPEGAAFLETLGALEKANPRFRLIATMTDKDKSDTPWNGETGFIDGAMVRRYIETPSGPVYSIAGPPEMVEAMRRMLIGTGVDPDDLRTEEFAGY